MTDWQSLTDEQIMDVDLIIALGLETASDEDKQNLIEKMATAVQNAVAARVGQELPEDKQPEVLRLLKANDHDAINAFFEAHVPQFGQIVMEETVKFKRAMLSDAPGEATFAAE